MTGCHSVQLGVGRNHTIVSNVAKKAFSTFVFIISVRLFVSACKMNSSVKFCVDSTLSTELAHFKLSPGIYHILMGVCIANGLLSPVAVLGNGLVLVVILKFSSLHTNSNILIFSLATTDILIGLVVQPSFVVYIASKLKLDFSCKALMSYLFTEIFCVGLSILMLSLVCCDRYFAIVFPYKYLNRATKSRVIKTVAICWSTWFAFNVICRALKVKNDEFFSPIASVVISVSFSLNIVLNFKIFQVVRLHKRQILAHKQVVFELKARGNPEENPEGSGQEAADIPRARLQDTRLAISVLLISGVLILCYLPLMLTSVADMMVDRDDLFDHVIYPLAETVAFLNSSLNPFLYCLRFRELRRKVDQVLKMGTSSNNN